MWLAIIKYWQVGAGALAAFAISWMLHMIDVTRIENNWRDKMEAAIADVAKACADSKKLTEENDREYTKQIDDLGRKLAAAKRMQPTRCIVPVAGQAGVGDGRAAGDKLHRQNGVTSDALFDFAGECERLRVQVISLQSFINGVWDGKAPK